VATVTWSPPSIRAGDLGRLWQQALRLAAPAALVLILTVALVLRVRDLPAADGILDIDEARLTLAAQGIAEHGLPVFPSGKLYTRGLVQSLLMAPSVALVGPIELAARLPSVVAGVALVFVVYAYGSRLAGPGAGLFAAALTATSVPLIAVSRQAWLYSIFILLWMLSFYLLDRAVASGSRRSLLLGLAAGGLSFLAHEFALALLPAVGWVVLCYVRAQPGRRARLWPILAATLLVGLGLVLMAAFSLRLRSDTVGGTLSEIRGFLALNLSLDQAGYVFSRLLPGLASWLLGPLVLAAVALAGRPLSRRLLLPLLGGGALLVLISFLLSTIAPRYPLALLPIVFLLASAGLVQVAERLRRWLPARWATPVLAALGLLVFAGQVDYGRVFAAQRPNRIEASWVTQLQRAGYRPGDLVLTNNPTVTQLYLGHTDYWVRSNHLLIYVRQQDDHLRDIHTDAIVVRDLDELEQALGSGGRRRTAWVIIWLSPYHWNGLVVSEVRGEIERRARRRIEADQWRIYELRLR
jgi:4-amino-4-deoxy-L-arabinose transferase-like glycosyltransferase